MKNLILAVVLSAMSLGVYAGDKGNGGDPIRVHATAFPKMENLSRAVEIAENSISTSTYMIELKRDMLKELKNLSQNNLIKYIPREMVLLPDFSNYPYIVSVGAVTELTKGSIIYLTKQSLNYNAEELARVLLQEIPHHILTNGLEKDEAFINGLGQLLIDGKYEEDVNKKLEKVYYKNEYKIAQDLIRYVEGHTNCSGAPKSSLCRCDSYANEDDRFIRMSFNGYLKELKLLPQRPRKFTQKAVKKALRSIGYSGVDRYGRNFNNSRCISIVELGDYLKSLLNN